MIRLRMGQQWLSSPHSREEYSGYEGGECYRSDSRRSVDTGGIYLGWNERSEFGSAPVLQRCGIAESICERRFGDFGICECHQPAIPDRQRDIRPNGRSIEREDGLSGGL